MPSVSDATVRSSLFAAPDLSERLPALRHHRAEAGGTFPLLRDVPGFAVVGH